MDLKDATLMFLTESAAYPAVAEIARSAYDRLVEGDDIDYRVLDHIIDEASGKGVLRAMRQKYGPVAFEAIVQPVLQEVGQRKPIRSDRYGYTWQPGAPRPARTDVPGSAGLPTGPAGSAPAPGGGVTAARGRSGRVMLAQ